MRLLQRLFMAVLPASWGRSMQRDSQAWKMRCTTCGHLRSIWDAGGIRWKAYSVGKRMYLKCEQCNCMRVMAIEYLPDAPSTATPSPTEQAAN